MEKRCFTFRVLINISNINKFGSFPKLTENLEKCTEVKYMRYMLNGKIMLA